MQEALDPVAEAVAGLVREMRRRHGLSQAELAAALGCDQSLVSRLESGGRRVSVEDLLRIAAASGATITEVAEELVRVWELVPHPESIWEREEKERGDA